MPRLPEIQLHLRDAVIHGDGGDVQHVAPWFVGGRDPEKRLRVHQRNYQTSLVDALLVKFPATGWLIGTPLLSEAARRFVCEHPPQAPCIAEYGATFPDFLARCPGTARLPYLREFAQLESYVALASIAVDLAPRPPLLNAAFSTIKLETLPDLRLMLQPGLHYLHASWPVDELMKLYLTDTAPDQFDLSPADVCIEIRGARGEFQMNRLDAADFIFRKSVSEGDSIGDAAERALDADPGFDPGRALAALIAEGLITATRRNGKEKTHDHV